MFYVELAAITSMKGFLEKTEKGYQIQSPEAYGKLRTLTKAHKLNFILIGLLPFIFGKSPCIDRYIRFKPLYFDMHFNCFIFS